MPYLMSMGQGRPLDKKPRFLYFIYRLPENGMCGRLAQR